ncbi:hypothetical protein M8286_02660 [Streptococcus suis]|uniref:hypothetical protein n=1 Tax=Streptococcus suis TaxID=1307 RepID=UPI0023D887D3|nr:hypothetical protein M8286_02660 [Streptococcus suis]
MKIKSSLGNEAEDRTGVHQGKLTTDNFDFRRVLSPPFTNKTKELTIGYTFLILLYIKKQPPKKLFYAY